MAPLLAVVLATLHLENDNLITFYEGIGYLCHYFSALYSRCAYGHCSVFVYEQHFVKLNRLALFCITHVINEELLALLCLELLTVNFYNCVHYFMIVKRVLPPGGTPLACTYTSLNGINRMQSYKI